MAKRTGQGALVASLLILLTACTTASGNVNSGSSGPSASPGAPASSGMQMQDAARRAGPSSAARMICSRQVKRAIERSAATGAISPGTDRWANHRYTCGYRTPIGPIVLSVQDSPNAKSGRRYFRSAQQRADGARPLAGLLALGLPSYETAAGTVSFLKDGKKLIVDARGLPGRVGPSQRSRTDVAYAIAAAVVACWSE